MRLVIQRVKNAKVTTEEKIAGQIGKGLFVLLGVGQGDRSEYVDILADKLVKMRLMADDEGKINLSVADIGGEILVVSQFTLFADVSKGNRPSFVKAAKPELAKELYEHFVRRLEEKGVKVATGSFGDYMQIQSTADGPVTITLEYPDTTAQQDKL